LKALERGNNFDAESSPGGRGGRVSGVQAVERRGGRKKYQPG